MSSDDRWSDDELERDDDRGRYRPGPAAARGKVAGPAIGLMVVGVVSLLMIAFGVTQYGGIPGQIAAEKKKLDDNPQLPADQKQQAKEIMDVYERVLTTALPVQWGLVALTSLLTVVGGAKMKSLSSRGWAKTAAILAMIPCVSGCCLLGLPIGIWALVVMSNPDVKAAFAAARRSPDTLENEGERWN